MSAHTRPVHWIGAARKVFDKFPDGARSICVDSLSIAAEGGKADVAKPMSGFGSGVFEIAPPFRGNAFRVVHAAQMADALWVIHAFQKKSSGGASRLRSMKSI